MTAPPAEPAATLVEVRGLNRVFDTVHAVLFEDLSPRDGLLRLLARDTKSEKEIAS